MFDTVERVELNRLAGNMVAAIEYLTVSSRAHSLAGTEAAGLARMALDLTRTRERLIKLAEALPEGPLEAFAREHPQYDDPIDGPYCGYRDADGKPYSCPVADPVRHWDAWELMGTRHRRPPSAKR